MGRCKVLISSSLRGRWDWTAAPCRASTTPAWTRPFFPARESSRTLSAALATAIQLPCFRAILASVLRRRVAGPNRGVDRTRSDPSEMEKYYEHREERPDREGLLCRDRPRRQGGSVGARRRRHRVDHSGRGLAAGRHTPRACGIGGFASDGIQDDGN